jgi:hypothetical protein
MYNNIEKSLFLIAYHIIIAHAATAQSLQQDPELLYADRGNRYEGIVERPAGSGPKEVKLLSVAVNHDDDATASEVDWFKLRLLLENATTANVIVHHSEIGYKMEPKRTDWSREYPSFSWPTDAVLRRIDSAIKIGDLAVIAYIGSDTADYISPVLLYTNKPPVTIPGYTFIFEAEYEMRILYKWVIDDGLGQANEGSIIRSNMTLEQPFRPFAVRWDGKTASDGIPCSDGNYKLILRIRRADNYEKILPYPWVIRFIHKQFND